MWKLSLPFFGLLFGLSLLGASADSVWRLPVAVPAGCSEPGFELLLFDVSGSMVRSGSFGPAQKDATRHVLNGLPACTLAVVASFGVTADVRGGEFLTDKAGRRRVADSIAALRATQDFTNLDEAAKLIELLDYQLRAAYGVPANRLTVRAYTDNQAAPSAGKSRFSLGDYLARRMNARHVRVDSDEMAVEAAARPSPPPPQMAKRSAPWGFRVMKFAALRPYLAGTLVVLFFFLLGLRRVARQQTLAPSAVTLLQALLVAESTAQANGHPARPAVRELRVDVLTRVPVVFSTDPNLANYVAAPLPGGTEGELFRITPLANGQVKVESHQPEATVNGRAMGRRGVRASLHQPLRIAIERRIFLISGVFAAEEARRTGEDLFQAQAMKA